MDLVNGVIEWLFSRSPIEYIVIVIAVVLIVREVIILIAKSKDHEK